MPGVGGLLADIRGGARLKKVSDQEKRDRSAAAVPGGEPVAPLPAAGGSGGGDAAGGGLAGALASALAARKSKVGGSGEFSCLWCSLMGRLLLTVLQMTRKMTMIGRCWIRQHATATCYYAPGMFEMQPRSSDVCMMASFETLNSEDHTAV
jgi:hypothetical protein